MSITKDADGKKLKEAKITRTRDGLTKTGKIAFVRYKMDGNYMISEPEIGCSLILDPGITFTWLTTAITEVVSPTHIKTKNSEYKIEYL